MDSSACLLPPASSRLPIEILQQIYHLLSPFDFDAARHTCRLWLFASLDKTLLTSHLVFGGWQAGAEQDLQEASDYFGRKNHRSSGLPVCGDDTTSPGETVSAEWIKSKRLAAETRLCSEWRHISSSNSRSESQPLCRGVAIRARKTPAIKTPSLKGATPSTPVANFTVSGCSKFVLLIQDRVVFIYSLQSFKSGMRPLTSIFCYRRIVKVSMDTSCGRHAVAILLEGRIGMCCEVDIAKHNVPTINRIHPSMSLSDFRNFDVRATSRPHAVAPSQDRFDFDLSSPTRSRLSPRAESYRRRGHALGRSDDTTIGRGSSFTLTDSNFHNGSREEFNPPVPNASLNRFFPQRFVDDGANESSSKHYPHNNFEPIKGTSVSIELGARKVYKDLCSVSDPPKSVAICPQRQCVAFGCNTGVELHWIDALRGTTLSRYLTVKTHSSPKLT
jgi:hypothetical protein